MKKWIVMLAVLFFMFCLAGCGEKPMTAVYFHTDDNSWYFCGSWTRTRFSPERYLISLRMRMERS